jgi:hypothetical protein
MDLDPPLHYCTPASETLSVGSRVGKNPGLKIKKQPSGFFWVFGGFLVFFWPDERVLGLFSVSRILIGASRL